MGRHQDFTVQPLLLGGGTPVFSHMTGRVDLELIGAREIGEGCALVRYRVRDLSRGERPLTSPR